jgi:hypothetical protein
MIKFVGRLMIVIALVASSRAFAIEQPPDIPAWLQAHVGEGDGQIALVVLQRARALYFQKARAGLVKNRCYFGMDATRPHDLGDGKVGTRFYAICESDRSFHAISAGHGGGRDLRGIADFANAKRCAKNFGNALDSFVMTGGNYVTGETKTSFKGYYRTSANQDAALVRSFVQFDGEGETANARQREIGGHAAALLRHVCLRKDPHSTYADQKRLRSVRGAGSIRQRPQRWLHQLGAVRRRANRPHHEGQSDHAVHLPPSGRHRRGCASGEGRPVVVARGTILERFLFEGNWLAEILAQASP